MKRTPKNQSAASPEESERLFLRARGIAQRFNVTAKTVHRWANEGFISRRKITSRIILFDLREVQAFVDSCKVTSPAATGVSVP